MITAPVMKELIIEKEYGDNSQMFLSLTEVFITFGGFARAV